MSSEEEYDEIKIVVDGGQTPLRIDRFLMDRLMKVSRSKIQSGITGGDIIVNGESTKANYKVRPFDEITVKVPKGRNEPSRVKPEEIELDIIYEDDVLMVINKSAGMVVHPGIGNPSQTLVNAIAFHLENDDLPIMEGNTVDRPGLVHRIDKNTSGLLVIAKTEKALSHLAKQFFDRTTGRRYLALIWGQPEEEEGTIDAPIGRDPNNRLIYKVVDEEEGKRAITHYKVLEPMYYVSLIECTLETGRTHQIRVHMNHLGHPLFGDERYGGDRIVKGTVYQKYKQFVQNCFDIMPHHALHATSLAFSHPETGERLHFEIEPPKPFLDVVEKWRKYLSTRKNN